MLQPVRRESSPIGIAGSASAQIGARINSLRPQSNPPPYPVWSTLIETAKLNGVDPRAWLADVLKRLPGHFAKRIHELLPWNWTPPARANAAA